MGTLEGKAALVTGGSRGIGAAIAKRLGQEGAAVAITYVSAPQRAEEVVREITAAGGKAVALRADSADAGALREAVDEAAERLGRLDILVNNAGTAVMAPLPEFSLEDFDRLVAVNVRGVFVASQQAARHMGEGGRIITIGSVNADRTPFPGGGVYAMTKAAVAGLTRGLARELGPRGITINVIQPGPTATDANPEAGEFADAMRERIAVAHYGRPADIASAVAYLASPEAGFITGISWNVDGGFAA